MVGAADDLPGIAVVVDVTAPGERLEPHAHAALRGALTQLMEIRGGAVDPAEAFRRHVAANHQQIAAKLRHQIEFALGANEVARAFVGRHAFEIAERLKGHDLQAEIFGGASDILRRAVKRQQIVLKISTPLKPAAAMARSFSSSPPLRQTVAIAVFMVWPHILAK